MKENYMVCNCKQVSYADIAHALEKHEKFDNVIDAFKDVQLQTQCSTGCGGCHDKIMDVISELLMGPTKA